MSLVVVGGGPAGMMAAIRAAALQQSVILLEKNPILGKKLLLSGKGRCNLTNACDLESFIARFSKNGQFLRDAFKKFFNVELMRFFEERGLPLKTERQLRVFPSTDKSYSIERVLKDELHKAGVKIFYKSACQEILVSDNKVSQVILEDGRHIAAEKVILATGGVSYQFTGSTGEGLRIAEKLGHRIVPVLPGLVPLHTRQEYPKALEGLTLKNIRLTFCSQNKKIESEIGELMFTRFGISGPMVLTLSGKAAEWLHEKMEVWVLIDLKPALSLQQVDHRLQREFKENPAKQIASVMKSLLPMSMVPVFLEVAGVKKDKRANQVTLEERKAIAGLLKGFRLDISKASALEEAMVTKGGISLKEINPRTMESRIIKGLYFAGEMIDVDADTGGFNLQAAFSTGYLAGESAALS